MKAVIAVAVAAAAIGLAPQASADEPFYTCPSGQSGVATRVTSCPFADSVRHAYLKQGPGHVVAYSPVTGSIYNMWCETGYVATLDQWPWEATSVRCSGGDNAVVVLW